MRLFFFLLVMSVYFGREKYIICFVVPPLKCYFDHLCQNSSDFLFVNTLSITKSYKHYTRNHFQPLTNILSGSVFYHFSVDNGSFTFELFSIQGTSLLDKD